MSTQTQERNELFDRIRDALQEHSAYALAELADSGSPDGRLSAGAQFLYGVRTAVLDTVRWQLIDADGMEDYGTGSGADWKDEAVSEIGDSAPSVYTHTLWQEFVDLAAYREEEALRDIYGDGGTLESQAHCALRFIAERLALALLDEAHALWITSPLADETLGI